MQILTTEVEISLVDLLEKNGFNKSHLKNYVIAVNGQTTSNLKQTVSIADRVVVLPKVTGGNN